MMSVVHLLWIVPLAGSLGGIFMAAIIGGTRNDDERWWMK